MVSAIERQILQSKVIERIQQVQQQHPDLQQQYFEVHLGQERRRMTKKINESEEMYHIEETRYFRTGWRRGGIKRKGAARSYRY
jgi:hypothetical protein